MPTIEFACLVPAPLDRAWAFHQDVHAALPALSPPEAQVRIESAEPLPPRVGTVVTITARGPLGKRLRWVARYVEFVPPHPVAFGEEARFVDEQESGPFKSWRHAHEFEHVDEKTTRMLDRITYVVPFGPIGWIADALFVRRQIKAMFRHRHAATISALVQAPPS
jgi:ligand-binding SRPBCC domain-containing protein